MSKKLKIRAALCCILVFAVAVVFQITKDTVHGSDDTVYSGGTLKVHFIDVGQADCILIQSDGKNMLIDAGNNEDGPVILEYLRKQGVNNLDFVIATHGHEDHIGAMDDIIRSFKIGEFFMPFQEYDSKSYLDVLNAASEKGLGISHPKFKESRLLGSSRFLFVTPNAEEVYEDVNDSSVGIRLSDGAHSFLMCGDISKSMEKSILDSKVYVQSDVLKLSHHGSSDTNSLKFLKRVDPEYAVLTCQINNDFGHPHATTIKKLKKCDIRLFRTDEQGSIVFTSKQGKLICNVNPLDE